MTSDLEAHLASLHPKYSPGERLLRVQERGGEWRHNTRSSLQYALALLSTGDRGHALRAAETISRVLELQDTDTLSETYGVWPWTLEVPLSEQRPIVDLNTADFLGALLAECLAVGGKLLPVGLQAAMKVAVEHAASCIFRRNVSLGYTNIAIMGAAVAVVAGELLDRPVLLEYGRRKLRALLDRTVQHGSFSEYNSPAYTPIVLHESERVLRLAHDPIARDSAERLRALAWETIAEHFHPATQQWAGPHSRAYSNWIEPGLARELSVKTSVDISPHPAAGAKLAGTGPLTDWLPCPAELLPRFRELPQAPVEIHRCFLVREPEEHSVYGTTWLDHEACLGSINRDTMRDQRRPVLAYWRTPEDPAVVLRLRFLKNGRDFASAFVRSAQVGPRVLSCINMLTNQGDVHPFDRPADGLFAATDFRVRYELIGVGAAAHQLGGGRYALAAGGYQAIVHTLPGQFGSEEVRWELAARGAAVEGICYSGGERKFDLAALQEVFLASALELLPTGSQASESPQISAAPEPGQVCLRWVEGLCLTVPTQPEFYPYLTSAAKV